MRKNGREFGFDPQNRLSIYAVVERQATLKVFHKP